MADLILNNLAEMTIDAFPHTDKEHILSAIDQLKQHPADVDYKKIEMPDIKDKLYVMKVSPDIRIILQLRDDTVEILDIVRHSRLEKMFKH